MYIWFIQVNQILLLYGFDMLPLVDTKTLLLYSFDVLPFVDTWVSNFALVLV